MVRVKTRDFLVVWTFGIPMFRMARKCTLSENAKNWRNPMQMDKAVRRKSKVINGTSLKKSQMMR